ncbi:uncharacterized protein L969DRAFT_55005 [Mixia osmundae IAM 14324]|uniref:uncharacterized protein n=1 Tax=Mixia osmundae (strain CBS 9802 / IAM 14324 / JCM 22182 / KY 12970) TaxID=764103 RepID=UPI0004A55A04|nr:uncharacterized protein L969DRAFT_55005 [Mixia osmundae IAM 14324]KEI36484.1 hypothetical protein L969DRAFT_55005 [Mixia osmundae IAM 14324]
MAANFWLSTHANYWLVDRHLLSASRQEDLRHATPRELGFFAIWLANFCQKLAKRLHLRQQVTATAIVFLRRFYLKNSYLGSSRTTDPCLVAATCLYVATKAEETPVHIKAIVAEGRATCTECGMPPFSSDTTKVAEMEFCTSLCSSYTSKLTIRTDLLEELEFHLIVYHPYQSLVKLCGRDPSESEEKEADCIDLEESHFQMAWYIINDTYRSDLCLLYPPYIIAVAAIYLCLTITPPESIRNLTARDDLMRSAVHVESFKSLAGSPAVTSSPALGSPAPNASTHRRGTEPVTFLASLNVQMPILLEAIQEMTSLYALWRSLEEETSDKSADGAIVQDPDVRASKAFLRARLAAQSAAAHPSDAGQISAKA